MAKFCKICGAPVSENDYMCMTCGNYLDVKKNNKKKKTNKRENTTKKDNSTLNSFVNNNPVAMDLLVAIFSLLTPTLSVIFIFLYGYKNKKWVKISLGCIMIRIFLKALSLGFSAI